MTRSEQLSWKNKEILCFFLTEEHVGSYLILETDKLPACRKTGISCYPETSLVIFPGCEVVLQAPSLIYLGRSLSGEPARIAFLLSSQENQLFPLVFSYTFYWFLFLFLSFPLFCLLWVHFTLLCLVSYGESWDHQIERFLLFPYRRLVLYKFPSKHSLVASHTFWYGFIFIQFKILPPQYFKIDFIFLEEL